MADLLIGVDIGTTATKVTVFDPSCGVVAARAATTPHYSAHAGWSEAHTASWWGNVCGLVPEALAAANAKGTDVQGVACSGMVPAVVLLDEQGRVLRPAILQNDARAADEITELGSALDRLAYDVLAHTGSALTQQSVAPTWRWLARHEPDVLDRTAVVVGSYDWLAVELGAELHVEANWALESGLYEMSGEIAAPVLEAAGVPARVCPPVGVPGQAIGEVNGPASQATSLPQGVPIYVGGADHVLAAYAAGLGTTGDWLVKLGGAGDILVVTDTPAIDRRWYLDAHPEPGRWLPNGCMSTSGSLLRWFQTTVGGPLLAQLDREAGTAAPASVICLPYFLGEKSPLHDPDLRGAFVGVHLGTSRGDMFRACMEATAFGFRNHVDAFAEAGVKLDEGKVSNGGSGSMMWKQIVADVLGRELTSVVDHGGASLGAAFVAGVGAGVLPDWEAATRFVKAGPVIHPLREHAGVYQEAYEMYLELQHALAPVSHRLAARSRL
jgi:xylulokinase